MDTNQIRRFRRSLRQFERLNTFQLKNCCADVTFAQCLVLLQVDEAGRPSMRDLAAALRLDSSTLTRTIDGLVAKQLVDRLRNDADRRTVQIALTAGGRRVCATIHDDSDACVLKLFDNIPASNRESVIHNFETLVNAFLVWESERNSLDCSAARPSANAEDLQKRS